MKMLGKGLVGLAASAMALGSAVALEVSADDRRIALELAVQTQRAVMAAKAAFDRNSTHPLEHIIKPLRTAAERWDNERRVPDQVKDTHLGCKSAVANLRTLANERYVLKTSTIKSAWREQVKKHLADDLASCEASIKKPTVHYIS
ncbi:MAG: hypothetical protein NTZ11_10810 [Gammaproteobacteria bacterium]|nr:hypothetical protein [Gammaproteobacteria bacterium]